MRAKTGIGVLIIGLVGLWVTPAGAGGVRAAGVAEAGHSVWIQVGARASGLAGSRWRTDLGLRSVAAAQANVEVRFYPAGGGAMLSQTTQVAPGAQSVLEDVVGQLGGSGNGAMEVVSDRPVIVTSRTYNQIAAGAACTPGGTFGQYYAAHRIGDGLGEGESAWLVHLAESTRFRSNIALTNMGTASATVQVELFDGAGGLLHTFSVTVGPARFHQEGRVFSTRAGQSNVQRGSVRVTVIAGSGIIASASVVDNVTNDPTTIPALRVVEEPPPGEEITVMLPGDVPLVMVRIPAGTFMMGAPQGERGRFTNEGPQHQVTLTQDFFLGKYAVTQRQWLAVMDSNPSQRSACGLDCPVDTIKWNGVCGGDTGDDCLADSFIDRLNAHLAATSQPGAGKFRMPTEAEWERGARGGTTGPFSFDTSGNPEWDTACGAFPEANAHMWWCGNDGDTTHPVGQKLPNPYGLFDVHGSVLEMVADWYGLFTSESKTDPTGPSTGTHRVVRSAGWALSARGCRSASRDMVLQHGGHYLLGFRLARSL